MNRTKTAAAAMVARCTDEGDRAVLLEFGEFLAGAGPAPRVRLRNGETR